MLLKWRPLQYKHISCLPAGAALNAFPAAYRGCCVLRKEHHRAVSNIMHPMPKRPFVLCSRSDSSPSSPVIYLRRPPEVNSSTAKECLLGSGCRVHRHAFAWRYAPRHTQLKQKSMAALKHGC